MTIGTIVTFMFHSIFTSLARSRYLSFFSHSFRFILWSAGTAKLTILQILFFFLLIIIRSGLLAGIRWSVCMLKSHRNLCVSFSRTDAGLCIYHLLVWSNWNFLHISLIHIRSVVLKPKALVSYGRNSKSRLTHLSLGLVWFLYLISNQFPWLIESVYHPCGSTVVRLFSPLLREITV